MDTRFYDKVTSEVYRFYSFICKKYELQLDHWMAGRLIELTRHEAEYGVLIETDDLSACIGLFGHHKEEVFQGLKKISRNIAEEFNLRNK